MSNILELHVSCVGLGCDRLTFCEMLHACLVSPCGFGFCHCVCVCVCQGGEWGIETKITGVCVLVVVLAFTMGHLWRPSQRLFWQPITAGKGNDPREETEEKSECYTKVSQTRTYTQVIFVLIVFIWKHKPPTFKSFSYLRNISKHFFIFIFWISWVTSHMLHHVVAFTRNGTKMNRLPNVMIGMSNSSNTLKVGALAHDLLQRLSCHMMYF